MSESTGWGASNPEGNLNPIWEKLLKLTEQVGFVAKTLGEIERRLPPPVHEYYTTETFPLVVTGKWKKETVADYCLKGKLLGFKTNGGRGSGEYRIPHEEYVRYQAEGLRTGKDREDARRLSRSVKRPRKDE